MNLTPVESSHIAAIGYLEAERVLLVRYKDGSLYAFLDWLPALYVELMASRSKGRFMMGRIWPSILIAKGVMPTEAGIRAIRGTVAEPGGNAAPSPGPLNVIDEDADKCCHKTLNAMFARGIDQRLSAECSDCGTQFWPEKIGECCYWRIKSNVAIVRSRR